MRRFYILLLSLLRIKLRVVLMADGSTYKQHLARALKKEGVNHLFTATLNFNGAKEFREAGIKSICCSSPSNAAFAADAYARYVGIGLFFPGSDGGFEKFSGALQGSFKDRVPVIWLLEGEKEVPTLFEEYARFEACLTDSKDANQIIRDAVSAKMENRSPAYVLVDTGALIESSNGASDAPTLSRNHVLEKEEIAYGGTQLENDGTSKLEAFDVINPTMKSSKDILSSEQTIILSEMPCLKAEFPRGWVCEFGRYNGSIGWSVGATIGYALAAQGKRRLITFITDSSFPIMAEEMSTMLNINLNNIIVVLNTSPHTNVVTWDCRAPIDPPDDGQLKLWTTKVYCEKQLSKAIREAIYFNEHKLCVIEVFIEGPLSFENLRPLFGEVLQEKSDGEAYCVICRYKIVNKDSVVSHQICHHVFHLKCFEELCMNGQRRCPLDRSLLAGPCKTWIFKSDHVEDDDILDDGDSKFLYVPTFNVGEGSGNIENQCSCCVRPYQRQDEKVTLLLCSHTYCSLCFEDITETCSLCGGSSEPYSRTPHDDLITMSNALEDTNWIRQADGEAGQEMPPRRLSLDMISDVENLYPTQQERYQIRETEEHARYHQNEVNNIEGAAWNEETENADADSSYATLEMFWETYMFDQDE